MEKIDLSDKGLASRKLWFSIGTAIAIIGGAIFCGFVPAAVPVYPELVGGLLAVQAIYLGGNVFNKFAIGKVHVSAMEKQRRHATPE